MVENQSKFWGSQGCFPEGSLKNTSMEWDIYSPWDGDRMPHSCSEFIALSGLQ